MGAEARPRCQVSADLPKFFSCMQFVLLPTPPPLKSRSVQARDKRQLSLILSSGPIAGVEKPYAARRIIRRRLGCALGRYCSVRLLYGAGSGQSCTGFGGMETLRMACG